MGRPLITMDDIVAIIEATDWDDPDDADWAFERLDYNPSVDDSVIDVLTAVATNPSNDLEKREFAINALSRTGMSYAETKTICEAVLRDSPFLLRASIRMELIRRKFRIRGESGG